MGLQFSAVAGQYDTIKRTPFFEQFAGICHSFRVTFWQATRQTTQEREFFILSKPCKKCEGIERYKNGNCMVCSKKRGKQWREDNSEKCIEYSRRWRQENPGRYREYHRRWREDNPEKCRKSSQRWQNKNPEKSQVQVSRRRALKKGATSEPYSFKVICAHYNNKCLACGRDDLPLTIDHVIPLSKGGNDIASNIQPLCLSCNSKKGNHHQTDYRPDKGPKLPRQLSFWKR